MDFGKIRTQHWEELTDETQRITELLCGSLRLRVSVANLLPAANKFLNENTHAFHRLLSFRPSSAQPAEHG